MTLFRKMYKNTVGEVFRRQNDDIQDALSEETTVENLDQIASRAEFGGGAVLLNEDGVTIQGNTVEERANTLDWRDPNDVRLCYFYGFFQPSPSRTDLKFGVNLTEPYTNGGFSGEVQGNSGDNIEVIMDTNPGNFGPIYFGHNSNYFGMDGSAWQVNIQGMGGTDVDFEIRKSGGSGNLVLADTSENRFEIDGRVRHIRENKTLASDAFTITSYWQHLASQSGTADLLSTINGGVLGETVRITAQATHTITVKDAIGNIQLNGGTDKTVGTNDVLVLYFDGSNWQQESYSNN